jgi:hypothetical protein
VQPVPAWRDPGHDRGIGDLEVLTPVGDVLLGPQFADELDEFLGAGVTMSLVALAVSVRSEVVLPGHNVDPDPATRQVIEGRRGGREMGRPPVAGPDRDERLEGRRPGGERRGDGECVRATPTGAEQRTLPAVILESLRLGGQGL